MTLSRQELIERYLDYYRTGYPGPHEMGYCLPARSGWIPDLWNLVPVNPAPSGAHGQPKLPLPESGQDPGLVEIGLLRS